MYSVGEFSRIVGVHPNILRRWEKEGKLVPFCRSLGNQRLYSEEQVNEVFGNQYNKEGIVVNEEKRT